MNKTTTLRAGIGFKLLFIVIMFATSSSAKFYNATLRVDSSASPNNSSLREATMTSGQSRFAAAETAIVPFEISVSDQDILDLKQRLSRTRLPDQIANTSWEYGMNIRYLTDLLDYWENDYDWREQETMLNQFDQFKTSIEGLDLHFIHQLSENPNAIPLMVVHGWPGSISEFTKIIGPLTDPVAYGGNIEDSFHIIAPSLPGFGFSEKPVDPGYSPEKIAHLLAGLMERLGYENYAIAGGDWGAIINRHLANNYPDRLIGLHSNMIIAGSPEDDELRNGITEDESQRRGARAAFMANERGYQSIQGTKPQSLGYGLNDSPAGLAAWIVEKFHGWTDMPQGAIGNLDNHFTKDELLTNVSIYWFTQTITSSTRIYYENSKNRPEKAMGYIGVPTGASLFPAEIFVTPRSWAEASYNIIHWTVMSEGGHFAALEQPELYLQDLREFFQLVR